MVRIPRDFVQLTTENASDQRKCIKALRDYKMKLHFLCYHEIWLIFQE